jgi:precorrin-2 dehydrogenase / sirohydrochlorin ferrochelatase
MRYLPIELDVQGRDALFIGKGPEIVSKIDRLIAAGARITLLAEDPLDAELARREKEGAITVQRRAFEERDLEGKVIVFIAPTHTPDEEALAHRLHEAARREGRLFCVLDRPESSTFTNAAVVRVTNLTMTVSTDGRSPGAARRIREDLSSLFSDPRWGRYILALGAMRDKAPRGERAARMAEAVKGFAVEATLRFPDWFERTDVRPPKR